MNYSKSFLLTEWQIKLIRSFYIRSDWDNGLVSIYHPFGNTEYIDDMLKILNIPPSYVDDNETPPRKIWNKATREGMEKVFQELPTALQIVLVTGKFEPGEYRKTSEYDSRSWQKVERNG